MLLWENDFSYETRRARREVRILWIVKQEGCDEPKTPCVATLSFSCFLYVSRRLRFEASSRVVARRQLPLEVGGATTRRRDVLVYVLNAGGGGADAAVELPEALYLYPLQLLVVLRYFRRDL